MYRIFRILQESNFFQHPVSPGGFSGKKSLGEMVIFLDYYEIMPIIGKSGVSGALRTRRRAA
jgi:hypothetical protein